MNQQRITRICALVLGVCLFLSGCGVSDQPTPISGTEHPTPVAVASGGRPATSSAGTPTDTPTFTAQQWEQFKHDLTLTPTFTAKELEQYKQDLMQRDADRQATARANGKPPRRLTAFPTFAGILPTPPLGFFPVGTSIPIRSRRRTVRRFNNQPAF